MRSSSNQNSTFIQGEFQGPGEKKSTTTTTMKQAEETKAQT